MSTSLLPAASVIVLAGLWQFFRITFHLIDRAHESMRAAERRRSGVKPVKGSVICN